MVTIVFIPDETANEGKSELLEEAQAQQPHREHRHKSHHWKLRQIAKGLVDLVSGPAERNHAQGTIELGILTVDLSFRGEKMEKKMSSSMWLALVALYFAWGSTYLAIRFAVESLPPFFMMATRFLVAGTIVYVWRRLAGDQAPTRKQWRSAAIIGIFMLVGGLGAVSWAEQTVPSGITALIVAAVPLWIVLVDALRPGGKRPSWQTIMGLFVGLAGILILIGPTVTPGDRTGYNIVSVIALLLGTLSWAIGSVYSRGADLPKSPLLGTGMEMLAGSVPMIIIGLATGEAGRLDLAVVPSRAILGLAYLIVVGSLVGFAAYTWLLRVAPTSTVATYAFVNPIVAVVLGSLLAQEVLTARVVIAIPVILSAVAIIHLANRKRSQAAVRQATLPTRQAVVRQ